MKLICGPDTFALTGADDALRIILYGQPGAEVRGSAGDAARSEVLRRRIEPAPRAWDLLSIALSVVSADFAGLRDHSPDGWTREFDIEIAVADPAFWEGQAAPLASIPSRLPTFCAGHCH